MLDSSTTGFTQQQLLQAWTLLLQQPCLQQDLSSILRLMCTSNSMARAVHDTAAGQLELQLPQHSTRSCTDDTSLCRWLSKHGRLLKSFSLRKKSPTQHLDAGQMVSLLAAFVQAANAATTPKPLPLTAFDAALCIPQLLRCLPITAPGLTRLELGPTHAAALVLFPAPSTTAAAGMLHTAVKHASAPGGTPSPAQQPFPAALPRSFCSCCRAQLPSAAAAATGQSPASGAPTPQHISSSCTTCSATLSSLSSLRHITLHGDAADALMPALLCCSQLQSISLSKLSSSSVARLSSLPAGQLQVLRVGVNPNMTSWQRKARQPVLGHLTALTHLSCTGDGLFAVQPDEVLPPNLVELVVPDCPRCQPLLVLHRLQLLVMRCSSMDAQQLTQLASTLPGLSDVRLSYGRGDMEVVNAAAPGWPALQGRLTALDLRVYPGPLPAQTLAHIALLGAGLTRLAISGYHVQVEASPAELAAVLCRLSRLQQLKLMHLRLQDSRPAAEQDMERRMAQLQAEAREQNTAGTGQNIQLAAPTAAAAATGAGVAAPGPSSLAPTPPVPTAGGPAVDLPGLPQHPAPSNPFELDSEPSVHEWYLKGLAQQIAALPHLTSLQLSAMCLPGPPFAALVAATGLQDLQCSECDLCDADVALLARELTGLTRLVLDWNHGVRSVGLRCLSSLSGLRELCVRCGAGEHEADLAVLAAQLPGLVTEC